MWLLVVVCVSTVSGVPIDVLLQGAITPPAGNATVTSTLHVPQSALSKSDKGVNVSISLGPPQRISAETLEELEDKLAVQEGDMLMPEDRNAVQTLWADAIVYYVVSGEVADREANIQAAFRMISDFTCIRFRRRTTELNYLKFRNGKGCASFVGCQGGEQSLYYSRSCSVGNLCHEILHALGLHHEHTRQDRDQYITVNWDNIMPGKKGGFKKKRGNTLNLPYDLNSITHYGQYFFSVDGSPTLVSNQRGVRMGQRKRLSKMDIQKLNRLYHCYERAG